MIEFTVAFLHVLFGIAVGLGLLRLFRRDGGDAFLGWETVPLAFLLGWQVETGLLWAGVLSGLSLKTGMMAVGILLAPLGVWGAKVYRSRFRAAIRGVVRHPRWYEWFVLAVMAEKVVFSAWNAIRLPNAFSDAMTHWGGRGHSLYGGVNFSLDPAAADFLGHMGRNSYPLAMQTWQAVNAVLVGGWSDVIPRLHGFFFFVAIFWLVWAAGRRLMESRFLAACGALVVVAYPLNVWHAFVGFNDIGVAAFTGAAMAFFTRREWAVAGLFAAGAAMQKNEGMVMVIPALAAGAALATDRGWFNFRALGRFLAGAAVITPWLVYKLLNGLPLLGAHGQQYGSWNPEAPLYFLHIIVIGPSGGGFWAIWTVMLLLMIPAFLRDGAGRGAITFCVVYPLMLMFLYFFTTMDQYLYDQENANRLMLQFLPAAFLALALGFGLHNQKSSLPHHDDLE